MKHPSLVLISIVLITSVVIAFEARAQITNITQDVQWVDLVNVSVTGNKLTKSAGGYIWNSGAASQQQLPAEADGWVSTTVVENNAHRMIGLSESNANASYSSVDFAVFLINNGLLQVYESGVLVFTGPYYFAGDEIRVERNGMSILYKRNGSTFYTSSQQSSSSLIVDCSLLSENSTLDQVKMNLPAPAAPTVNLHGLGQVFGDGSGSGNYDALEFRSWLIKPNDGGFITLDFTAFDLANGDFLKVYDGENDQAALLGSFTGNTLPYSLTSSGNGIYLELIPNGDGNTGQGFEASYTSSNASGSNSAGLWKVAGDSVYYDQGNVGIGLSSPESLLHIRGYGAFPNITNAISGNTLFLSHGKDAGLESMANDDDGTWGGYLGLGVANSSGLVDKWGIIRKTSNAGDGSLRFTYGTNRNAHVNGLKFMITNDGHVGIGTSIPQAMLTVNGDIRATEIKVMNDVSVPDYVFSTDYELMNLEEIEEFVQANCHLPGIPSEADVRKDGLNMSEMQLKLLEKIEELTLYIIEQNKRINALEANASSSPNK